tara:strand:+ start:207 stop:617 length:411 start_codon:yes stop_codon:yes gene_type:complete
MELEHDKGPVGHSDGDTLLHAVTDAILGALGEPDIGRLFPDTAPENENADSRIFLEEAVRRMKSHALRVGNMDATIICERPKISPHADRMAEILASLLGCEPGQINIKGKTHERVDAVGEGRAIEVHVVVLLVSLD